MAGLLVTAALLRVCGRDPAPVLPANAFPSGANANFNGTVPPALHGGRVQIVGNNAVEMVAARSGGVALFWMDREGRPIPPSQVVLPSVNVDVGGRMRNVPVRVVGGAHVAHVSVPASANVAVTVPLVVVSGTVYQQVVVPTVIVVASLPGIIIVPAGPAVFGWHGKHRKFRGGWF